MTSPVDLLFQRLIQIEQGDPEAIAARLQDPETVAIRLAALPRPDASPEEIARNVEAQHASPYRPAHLSVSAVRHDTMSLYLAAAGAWVELYAASANGAVAQRIELALHIIEREGGFTGDKHAAASELQEELQRWAHRLEATTGPLIAAELHPLHRIAPLIERHDGAAILPTPTQPIAPPWKDGALALDLAFADLIQHTGKAGKEDGTEARADATARADAFKEGQGAASDLFSLWLPSATAPGARFALHLARCLWLDLVRPRLERRQRKGPPALARAMHEPVTELLSRAAKREDGAGGQLALRLPGSIIVSAVHTDAIAEPFLERGVDLFRSLTAHKVIRHLVFEAHRQYVDLDCRDPRVLHYPGGYSALATALDIKGNKGAEHVRAIIETMHCMDVPLAGATSRLLNRTFTEAKGQRAAHLTIMVGLALLPDYVFELAQTKSLEARRARDLIPLLPLPPIIGRANEAGAQATLSMHVVRHLRDHAPELAQQGSAPMPFDTFARMGDASGLPRPMAKPVLDAWLKDGSDAPAFLKAIGPDRYTLGDTYQAERAFLTEGGQRSLDSRAAGQGAAKRRQAARVRAAGGSGK